MVHAELLEGAVGPDQERQDVEPFRAIVPDQAGLRTGRGPDRFRDVGIIPGLLIDQHEAVRGEARPAARAGGDGSER